MTTRGIIARENIAVCEIDRRRLRPEEKVFLASLASREDELSGREFNQLHMIADRMQYRPKKHIKNKPEIVLVREHLSYRASIAHTKRHRKNGTLRATPYNRRITASHRP